MEIDFVIIWVDGADENWRKKRAKYKSSENVDNREIRYRDWELLKYWFRGVEKFAPWVRKVYFVSDDQCPVWLNKDNDKIRVVSHKDFIPVQYLPTFNSHVIELNLHRIEGLAEHFVYFNDDMFLLRAVKKTDFFKHGVPVDDALLNPIIATEISGIGNIITNDVGVINANFSKRMTIKAAPWKWLNIKYGTKLLRTLFLLPWRHFVGFYNDHLPQPFLKSVFDEVWQKEPECMERTCNHKFRDCQRDVSQWLIRFWQLASNRFYPGNPHRGKDINIMAEDAQKIILRQKYKMICMNDAEEVCDFEQKKKQLMWAFEQILPDKSSFEQ